MHIRPGALLTLVFLAVVGFGLATAGESPAPPHKLTGLTVEVCSCDRFCESAILDEGRRTQCSFVAAFRIEAGQRGEVSLGGLTAAVVVSGPLPDGKPGAGPVLYVDRSATPAQSEAIRAILSERLMPRVGTALGPPQPAAIQVTRTTEAVGVSIETVADLRARVLIGGFGRGIQLENVPATTLGYPFLGRGTSGQVADARAAVTFDAKGKNVFYGKFDFGNGKLAGRKRRSQ